MRSVLRSWLVCVPLGITDIVNSFRCRSEDSPWCTVVNRLTPNAPSTVKVISGREYESLITSTSLIHWSWHTTLNANRGLGRNEGERTEKAENTKAEFPAVGEACSAMLWPTPGFRKENLSQLWILSRKRKGSGSGVWRTAREGCLATAVLFSQSSSPNSPTSFLTSSRSWRWFNCFRQLWFLARMQKRFSSLELSVTFFVVTVCVIFNYASNLKLPSKYWASC